MAAVSVEGSGGERRVFVRGPVVQDQGGWLVRVDADGVEGRVLVLAEEEAALEGCAGEGGVAVEVESCWKLSVDGGKEL